MMYSVSVVRFITLCVCFAWSGCSDPAEDCNNARVDAHDAWTPLARELAEPCRLFEADPDWQSAYDSGLRFFGGGGGSVDKLAIGMAMDGYRPHLRDACLAVSRASSSSTSGAVLARDNANAAQSAITLLFAKHTEFAASVQDVAERAPQFRNLAAAALAHSQALTRVRTARLLDTAKSASERAWTTCRSVAP